MSETTIKMKSKEAKMIVTNFSGLNSKSMFYQYWKDDNEMIIEAWICKADELQNKLDEIKKLLKKANPKNKLIKNILGYAEWKDENNIKSNGWGALTYNGKLYTAHEISKMYETYKYSTK